VLRRVAAGVSIPGRVSRTCSVVVKCVLPRGGISRCAFDARSAVRGSGRSPPDDAGAPLRFRIRAQLRVADPALRNARSVIVQRPDQRGQSMGPCSISAWRSSWLFSVIRDGICPAYRLGGTWRFYGAVVTTYKALARNSLRALTSGRCATGNHVASSMVTRMSSFAPACWVRVQ
jgi:hypothetical protein